MARRIVVTSGKGGVGKTTVCANLGYALAMYGHSVVLIDADIGLNNLDVVMNVENKVVYDILDVVKGRCRPKQALIRDVELSNLFVLPSVKGGNFDEITTDSFKSIIHSLDGIFDYILIDCPAGVDMGFHRAVACCSEALVVSTPNLSSIRDADKVLGILATYSLNNVSLVVNRIRGDLVVTGDMLSATDIAKLLRVSPVGIIPADDDITLANTTTVAEKAKSSEAFKSLAKNIMGESKLLYDYTGNYKGVIGKVRGKLKRIL